MPRFRSAAYCLLAGGIAVGTAIFLNADEPQTLPISAPRVANSVTNSPPKQMLDPNQLVFNAVQQAVWGPPLTSKVRQQSFAFGQDVVLSGEYKAAGNGSGQFRYAARLSSGETTVDSIQVSDGRLMYTQIGEHPPRIVNVEKVRESLAMKLHNLAEHPEATLHLAIGGHAELLRNLYQRYHWYAAAEGTIYGIDVWQLVGRLRTEPPRVTGTARLDLENMRVQPQQDGLPMGVRLTLIRNASFPYFPHSVEYFRLEKDKDGTALDWIPVSKIDYLEPSAQFVANENDFTYIPDASADKTEWETNLYLP